jgi:hypothetical protein
VNPTSANGSAPAFAIGSSTATSFVVDNAGNVGVGTTEFITGASLTLGGDVSFINNGGGVIDFCENATCINNARIRYNTGFEALSIDTGTAGSTFDLRTAGGSRVFLDSSNNGGKVGISTTTPSYQLSVFSASAPQLSLSAGAGLAQTVFRNTGTSFYISTTTVAGTATTSTPLLDIALGGFGTTTVRGLSIIGQATSTSNVGFNITNGCYAVNGTCLTAGGSSASSTLLADSNYWTGTNNFNLLQIHSR